MSGKWDYKELKNAIDEVMTFYELSELPSRQFLEGIGRSDIFNAIARHGGFRKVAADLGLINRYNPVKWTEEKIENELRKIITDLSLTEMPSKTDLIKLGRNDLGCVMTKRRGMAWWANKVGLPLKNSETFRGNKWEYLVKKKIEKLSDRFIVEKMSTKHPYDLLVNGCVKIDVKEGKAHYHFGSRAHTFALNKKYATCDIYICVALDEHEEIENHFIIPAAKVQLVTLNIGTESKYNKYKNDWNFIYNFVNQYESAIAR